MKWSVSANTVQPIPGETKMIRMNELTGEAKARIMKDELGESYEYYMNLKRTLNQEGVLTRMPYDIIIE